MVISSCIFSSTCSDTASHPKYSVQKNPLARRFKNKIAILAEMQREMPASFSIWSSLSPSPSRTEMVPCHVQRKMELPERENDSSCADFLIFLIRRACTSDSQSELLMLWIVIRLGCWCCSPLIHPRNGRSAVRINTRPLFPRRALVQSKWFIYKRLGAMRAPVRFSYGRFHECLFGAFWRATLSEVLISCRDVLACQWDALYINERARCVFK